MNVDTGSPRAIAQSFIAATRSNVAAVAKASASLAESIRDVFVGSSSPSPARHVAGPLKRPSSDGIPTRPINRVERAMNNAPACFAQSSSGALVAPNGSAAANAALRCADGPVAGRVLAASTVIAGALDGALGLRSRPIPGYEKEYKDARKAAAIETLAVTLFTAAGPLRAAGATNILSSAGGTAALTPTVSASASSVGVAAALADHAALEAVRSEPFLADGADGARRVGQYRPAPRMLKGFPTAERAPMKTPARGGGHLRRRWRDDKGHILEWDSQHGRVEKYDARGRHLGEFDADTGTQTGPAVHGRRVER